MLSCPISVRIASFKKNVPMYKKKPTTPFDKFGFSAEILTAIQAVGYDKPTDIQQATIPKIIEGRDVLVGAETGSGKTAAFVLPILHLLTQETVDSQYGQQKETVKPHQIRALIIVPTRELAIQIGQEIRKFSKNIEPRVNCLSVYGGVNIEQPIKDLRSGSDFLVTTPGRFIDLIKAKAVKFNQLRTLILDEVDRLVGVGFKEDIDYIIKYLPNKRQNLFFTATFPDEIRPLVRQVLNNPEIIKQDQSAKKLIDQRVLTVNFDRKTALLVDLLQNNEWKQVLIFCSAKRSCDNLVKKLVNKNIEALALHGNKQQHERRDVLKNFKAGSVRILIATDVAARGLDIVQLPCVINYELPRSPNDYVHRIGRTGRAGEEGMAISLISHHEFQHFNVIEKRNGLHLAWETLSGFEADEIAPPPPQRSRPKKKQDKKRASKKQIKRKQTRYEPKIEPQATEEPTRPNLYKISTKTSTKITTEKTLDEMLDKKVSKPIPIPSSQPEKEADDTDTTKKPRVNANIWGRNN
jgi:superfamily II DNA/RNA helicase